MSNEVRFRKILALAVNPAALDGEAQVAFGKLRDLVRQNPQLSEPPLPRIQSSTFSKADEISTQWVLTDVAPFWFGIVIDNLSGAGYDLGLRCRIACDFQKIPTAIIFTCTGSKDACDSFAIILRSLIDYINSQPPQ